MGKARIFMVVCAVAAMAAQPASAHPPEPVGPRGEPVRGAIHAWLHQAKVPLVPGRIQVLIGDCPGRPRFVACIFSARPRRIYLSRRARDPRSVLYHELGHSFDLIVMRPRERRRFRQIVHRRHGRWWGGSAAVGEWFADAYAACARGRRFRARTFYGYRPTVRQHRAACRLIEDAGAPRWRGRPRTPPPRPPEVFEQPSPPQPEPPPAPPPGGSQPPPSAPPESEPAPGTCDFIERLLTGCKPA